METATKQIGQETAARPAGFESDFYSPRQLAVKCNVSIKAVTNWTQDRRLPCVKMGRVWRYPIIEIEKRLLNGNLLFNKNGL